MIVSIKKAKFKKYRIICSLLVVLLLPMATSSLAFAKSKAIKTKAIKPGAKNDDVNDMLAAASVQQGKILSIGCTACHTFEKGGPNKVGPNLFGIIGSKHAHKLDYPYSDAMMKKKDETWTVDKLFKWLRHPAAYVPGTKMPFNGLPDPQDRLDLIAFLMTLK